MKKAVIIIAIVLIAVGLILFVGALLLGGNLKTKDLTKKTYAVAEAFTGIRIDTDLSDVQLVRSTDGACSVVTQEADKLTYSVGVQDGTLVIKSEDTRNWLDMLIPTRANQVTVSLPSAAYAALSVKAETGKLSIPNDFTFDRIEIVCSTGDVQCGASATGALSIVTSTGDITVSGSTAQTLQLSASTGKIDLKDVAANTAALSVSTGNVTVNGAKIDGAVTLKVSTGRAEISDLTADSFVTEGSTGRLTLKNTVVQTMMNIVRSTGDVRFEACDAETITVKTGTGDVTGTLRSDKIIFANTHTGKVRVPQSVTGGRCEITTDTGDIEIEIVAP